MASKNKADQEEMRNLLERSAKTAGFFQKQGFSELSDVVRYAIKKSAA